MAQLVKIGAVAPDFVLPDQDGNDVRLSDYRGKKRVVLAFYPLDWSPVCEKENVCFTQDLSKFSDQDIEVLAISADSVYSHSAWAEKMGFKHKLLSDIKREVCKTYGLYLPEMNVAQRATVIIDKQGIIQYIYIQELGQARDNGQILEIVKNNS